MISLKLVACVSCNSQWLTLGLDPNGEKPCQLVLKMSLSSSHFPWTCRICNLRSNTVGWGSSAPRSEQKRFYQLFCHPHTTSVVCFMRTSSSLWDKLLCSSLRREAEVQPRCHRHRVLWRFPVQWCNVLFPTPALLCYLAEYTSRMWVNGAGMAQKIVSLVESLGFAGRLPAQLVRFYTHFSEQA